MARLNAIAELTWRQLFPKGDDETKITPEEFLATAKSEYAYQFWQKMRADKALEGDYQIPSYLLSEANLDVVDDEMDVSSLKIMQGLDADIWLQNVGGVTCKCLYIRSTLNNTQLLCGDDSRPEDARTYYPLSKKIVFPQGVHTSPLKIIYANSGQDMDGNVEVDDVLAGLIRRGLIEIYGKVGKEDATNNTNSDA